MNNVVLAGAYDVYGCGRVSNLLKSFNLLNMYLEEYGKEPRVIHEIWDNNMHLMKFSHAFAAGQTYK